MSRISRDTLTLPDFSPKNQALRSLACGIPMVSFNIGGLPDLVRLGETAYLAAPEDTTDFCNGIIELLKDSALRHQMAENCRPIALAEYPIKQQADRYIARYQGLLR